MKGDQNCMVYIGNIDDHVPEKVLYEILIQAGPILDFSFPVNQQTKKSKGYAFVAYKSSEVADYAVRLFYNTVVLYGKCLKFELNKNTMALSESPILPLTEDMEANFTMKDIRDTLAEIELLLKKARRMLQMLMQR
ncbi:hypothetical protein IFM89_021494 [Coptis chinensis]|uniref:RRM domain-containing protein n=1 Tax=Coptis chinensis TaxID=261450 RepID=A0A835H6S3_9MAGN|nr:hypothetical protein IFM89_021494 [Coptis chinensis]